MTGEELKRMNIGDTVTLGPLLKLGGFALGGVELALIDRSHNKYEWVAFYLGVKIGHVHTSANPDDKWEFVK